MIDSRKMVTITTIRWASATDRGDEGIAVFINTCAAGGDIDNDEEVTRPMHDSEVGLRDSPFPILTINSLKFLRIPLDSSAVDCPVEDVLPDSARIDLLTVSGFPYKYFGTNSSSSINKNFLNSVSSLLIASVISTPIFITGSEPDVLGFG